MLSGKKPSAAGGGGTGLLSWRETLCSEEVDIQAMGEQRGEARRRQAWCPKLSSSFTPPSPAGGTCSI